MYPLIGKPFTNGGCVHKNSRICLNKNVAMLGSEPREHRANKTGNTCPATATDRESQRASHARLFETKKSVWCWQRHVNKNNWIEPHDSWCLTKSLILKELLLGCFRGNNLRQTVLVLAFLSSAGEPTKSGRLISKQCGMISPTSASFIRYGGFHKMHQNAGVPSHHPFIDLIFPYKPINHPAMGVSPLMETICWGCAQVPSDASVRLSKWLEWFAQPARTSAVSNNGDWAKMGVSHDLHDS